MRFFLILLSLSLFSSLFAQRENSNWHFGCFAGINFAEDGTITQIPSSLQSREGTASVSDVEGNLLFYTDGINIYNSQNIAVVTDLLGDPSSTSSAVVVPVVGSQSDYWVFTSGVGSGNNGLNYYRYSTTSERIVAGPVLLINDQTEKLAVLLACGSGNYWLATQDRTGNYLIYSVGTEVNLINTTPSTPSPLASRQTTSYLKFSEDGTRLANALPERAGPSDYGGKVNVYDFDPTTGEITNPLSPVILDFNNDQNGNFIGFPYGLQFAPGGRFLYVAVTANNNRGGFEGGELYQYDLLAADVDASRTLLGQATSGQMSYGSLQLAPDGKIYMAIEGANESTSSCSCFRAHPFLGVIERPDEAGAAVGFTQNAITISGGDFQDNCGIRSSAGSKLGLPTFIAGTITSPAIEFTDNTTICPAEEIRLLTGPPTSGSTYTITGPDFISQDYFLTVAPEFTTTYTVRAELNACRTLEREITIDVIPEVEVEVSGNLFICEVDELDLTASTIGEMVNGTYTWILPDGSDVSGPRLVLPDAETGVYLVSFSDDNACRTVTSEVQIRVGENILMPIITITGADGDTIPAGAEVLSGATITLSVSGLPDDQPYSFQWMGNFSPMTGNSRNIDVMIPVDANRIDEVLAYTVIVTPEIDGCPVLRDVTLNRAKGSYKIPEVITPNGDGTNDFFRLFYRGTVDNYNLIIFNRWGQKVFSSSDPEQNWDGTLKGKAQNMDMYLYVMSFTLDGVRVEEDGSFSLIR